MKGRKWKTGPKNGLTPSKSPSSHPKRGVGPRGFQKKKPSLREEWPCPLNKSGRERKLKRGERGHSKTEFTHRNDKK